MKKLLTIFFLFGFLFINHCSKTEKIEISSSDEKKSSSLKERYFYEYIRKVINEDHFILKPVRIFIDLEDLNDMNYFLLIAVHLILVIFTLYRLWGKTCFNTLYKIIISILSLFLMLEKHGVDSANLIIFLHIF